MNTAPARSVIKKWARPGSLGPVQGRARPARHTCIGLLDLPGSISPAWKEERRKKKQKKEEAEKAERRKKKDTDNRRKKKKE